MNEDPCMYTDGCYSRELFLKIYENVLYPISGKALWPTSTNPVLGPPIPCVQAGRPRKARRKDVTENRSHSGSQNATVHKMKKHVVMHCRNCGLAGHNRATCKAQDGAETEHLRQQNATGQPNKFVAPGCSEEDAVPKSREESVMHESGEQNAENVDVQVGNFFQQYDNIAVQPSTLEGAQQSMEGANVAAEGDTSNPTEMLRMIASPTNKRIKTPVSYQPF